MKAPGFLKKSLILLLVANLAVPQAATVARATDLSHPDHSEPSPHPLLETLRRLEEPLKELPYKFPADSPCVDSDPFLLRSQYWREPSSASDLEVQLTEDDFVVHDPEAKRDLALSGAWNPIGSTEEWIFLLPGSAEFFARCGAKPNESEGIFVLDRDELASMSQPGAPVPVYFLPLPSTPWMENVHAIETADERVVVSDGRNTLTMDFEDIETMVQAERLNLFAAIGESARAYVPTSPVVYPLSGATAGFGIFLNPRVSDLKAEKPALSPPQKSAALRLYESLFGVPSAYAQSEHSLEHAKDNQMLAVTLTRVAGLMVAVLASAFVMKIVLRKELKRRRDEAGQAATPVQHIKEFMSLSAASWTTVYLAPILGLAHGSKFLIDRYAPRFLSKKNSILRWGHENSVMWYARVTERAPVDWRTQLFGVILGTMETTTFMLLCFWLFPPFLEHAIPWFPGAVEAARDMAMAPGENNYVRNEGWRNAVSWLVAGATFFATSQRSFAMSEVETEVEHKLRELSLKPTDPEYASEAKRLHDEYMEEALKKHQLPRDKDFLYDFMNVWNAGMGALGYKLPADFVPNRPTDEYLGIANPGYVGRSSRISTRAIARRLKADPQNKTLRSALALARKVEGDVGNLLTMTADGTLSKSITYIPESWVQKSDHKTAVLVANEFRKAFISTLEEEPEFLEGMSDRLRPWVRESDRTLSESRALEELKVVFSGEWEQVRQQFGDDFTGAEQEFSRRNATQLEILREDHRVALAKQNLEAGTDYVPEKRSWYSKFQQRRAIRAAKKTFPDAVPATPEQFREFGQAVARELLKQVGVKSAADLGPLEQQVHQRAEESTEHQLADRALSRYIREKLTPEEKIEHVALMYAENAVEAYARITVNNPQAKYTSKGKLGIWTRLSMPFRALVPNETHRLGLFNRISRAVPASYDAVTGELIGLRVLPTTLIALYPMYWYGLRIGMGWANFFNSMLFYFAYKGADQWLSRAFNFMGIRAMKSWRTMLLYSIGFSAVTSWGSPFVIALEKPVIRAASHVQRSVGESTAYAADLCAKLLQETKVEAVEPIAPATGLLELAIPLGTDGVHDSVRAQ